MEKTKMLYTSPESEVVKLRLEQVVLTGSGEGLDGWDNE